MCQLPVKLRSTFYTLICALAAMLVLGTEYARAGALPVLDLSGVWIAQARPATFCSGPNLQYSPVATYTLTLSRKDFSVTSSQVRIDYDHALVIDGFKVRDADGDDFTCGPAFESCQAGYLDDPQDPNRTAYSTSRIDGNGFDPDYNIRLASTTSSNTAVPDLGYLLRETGTPIEMVVDGRRLDLVPTRIGNPGFFPLEERCWPGEQGGGSSFRLRTVLRFKRIATSDANQATGILQGQVNSADQTETATEKEVQRFRATLLHQPDGAIRPQDQGEADSDYLDFLRRSGATVVSELKVAPDDEGNYPFGAPGAYRFDNVRLLDNAITGGYRIARYTVLISDGQTDEFVFDDQDMIVPGATSPLFFSRGFAGNLIPDLAVPLVEVAALDAIPSKRDLVARLSGLCETNYAPAEAPVTTFLDQLEAGTLTLTDERNEGVRRAVWAERAALGGVTLADQLLEEALSGLGTVIADAWDDLTDFSHKDLSQARKRAERVEGAVKSGTFNPSALSAKQLKKLFEDKQYIKSTEIYGVMLAAFKALKPALELALGDAFNDPAKVEQLTSFTSSTVIVVLASAKSGGLAGASKPLIKKGIETLVGATKPLFLDAPDPSGDFAYCRATRSELDISAVNMEAWNSFGPANYRTDRQVVVDEIGSMNAEATKALVKAQLLLGLGAGLDAAQDGAAVAAVAVKQAKAIEKIVQVSKYASNTGAFATAIAHVYRDLPASVTRAARAAYGETPIPELQAPTRAASRTAAPGRPARGVVSVPSFLPYLDALTDLSNAIDGDDMTAAIDLVIGEESDDLPQVRSDWSAGVRALLLRVLVAAEAGARIDLILDYGSLQDARLDLLVAELELQDLLTEVFEGVMTGIYSDNSDLDYASAKTRTLAKMESLRAEILDFVSTINGLLSTINSAAEGDAVLVDIKSVESEDTQENVVTGSPERFTVTARFDNLSPQQLSSLTARLDIVSSEGSTSVIGAAEIAIGAGSLAADDGVSGGSDEAEISWTVEYVGDFTAEAISLTLEVLSGGVQPDFVTTGAEAVIFIDPSRSDTDLDTMPNDFEEAFGLNPALDDANDDLDLDGVDNVTEYRLGTAPDDADTDDDGASDGEEVTRGNDRELTDPLVADSDGDGVDDGADGAPNDVLSADAPVNPGEPVVAVSDDSLVVTVDAPFVEVDISNAGDGQLLWTVESADDDRIATIPAIGTVNSGDSLLVTLASGYDFPAGMTERVALSIVDTAGSEADVVEIDILLGAVSEGADCGDADDSAGSGDTADVTATDALFTLSAAVGILSCEPCRCDVDASGAITATDALAVLKAAVGISPGLLCAPCS